jgi:hypothetical protein
MQLPARPYVTRRSESDILTGAPILVRLGGKEYEIPVLNNRKAAKWREKLFDALGPLVANVDFTGIDLNSNHTKVNEEMARKLSQEMLMFPEKLLELLLDYAGDSLKEADIMSDETKVTDEQIALAFAKVSEVGYPFFFHVWAATQAMATPAQKMPTPPATLQ